MNVYGCAVQCGVMLALPSALFCAGLGTTNTAHTHIWAFLGTTWILWAVSAYEWRDTILAQVGNQAGGIVQHGLGPILSCMQNVIHHSSC